MLYEDKIYEGLSIELIVKEGPFQGRFRTRIEEVGKKILTIGAPISERQYLPLREGTKVEVEFTDNIVAFSFETVILRRFYAPVPTFVIEHPNYIRKIQRRKHVRIPIVSQIRYQVIEKGGFSDDKLGYLIDLSGGGLRFSAEEKYVANDMLLVTIKTNTEELTLPVKVVRIINNEDKSYKVSCEYHEITEKTRDKIVAYIFEVQRELRRKGLM